MFKQLLADLAAVLVERGRLRYSDWYRERPVNHVVLMVETDTDRFTGMCYHQRRDDVVVSLTLTASSS